MSSYWSTVLNQRLTRRRAIAATGAGAAGAAFLAACGGSDSGGSGGDKSGLVAAREDETKDAKPGGVMQDVLQAELIHTDAVLNPSTATLGQLLYGYTQLVKAGVSATAARRPGPDAISGDSMDKWEITPDLQQVTFKVRPNHKFDPRPPTNGRAMTSDDVKFSWEKYVKLAPSAADVSNERSPVGPVASLTTPDASTVVMKLAFPLALILQILSDRKNFYVQPRLDDSFNFKGEMRGSGPFFLEKYVTSDGLYWTKNPDWYEKGKPYLDRIEKHLILDYAAGLTQFEAGNLWAYLALNPRDVIPVKQRHPTMIMKKDPVPAGLSGAYMFSGREDSEFKDVRVRRALSMTLDRQLLIDTFLEPGVFEQAGISVDKFWHSHIGAIHPEWVDPQGTGLGEGAKYFKHDPAEAKKLLEAAGVKTPHESTFTYYTDRNNDDPRNNQVMLQMMNQDNLFNMKPDIQGYSGAWRTMESSKGTAFKGLLFTVTSGRTSDSEMSQRYTPEGRNAFWDHPIPNVTDLVYAQRKEADNTKRLELVKKIQQNLALEWPGINFPGMSTNFTLTWPWLRNYSVFLEGDESAKEFTNWFYDPSKRPA